MRDRVSGVVLLRSTGDALLQRRDNIPIIQDPGMWVFPGGHVEPGETLEAGAHREFLEETMYDCGELHPVVVYRPEEIGYSPGCEVAFFWCLFDEKQSIRCCEGQELRFVLRHELKDLPVPSYLPRVWDLVLDALARKAIRR